MTGTLARAFDAPPPAWGLRGDPLLWEEMAKAIKDGPEPPDGATAERLLAETFARLTGVSLATAPDPLPVARYNRPTGMSSGLVSPRFWRETALPLLLSRLETHR